LKEKDIIDRLRSLGSAEARAGMARYGIDTGRAFGVAVSTLRPIAREIGRDHDLAHDLWASGFHEARLLATMIADPRQMTEAAMESWVADFDSWDVCDGACINLFRKTPFAHARALAWTERAEPFVKRAGFALMATLAVHDKRAEDAVFVSCLPIIAGAAADERNFVKKAVNWALRQIGKRNRALNAAAIACAEGLAESDSKAARWIARDALRELTSEKVQARLTN
jgi:3-methyladenine DNA glycosylase AlkD